MLINLEHADFNLMSVVLPSVINEVMAKLAQISPTQVAGKIVPLVKVLYGVLMAGMI